MLNGIADFLEIENKHPFIKNNLNLDVSELFEVLNNFGIVLNYENLLQMPLYEVAEAVIRGLSLVGNTSDAYIQFYLDAVL